MVHLVDLMMDVSFKCVLCQVYVDAMKWNSSFMLCSLYLCLPQSNLNGLPEMIFGNGLIVGNSIRFELHAPHLTTSVAAEGYIQ